MIYAIFGVVMVLFYWALWRPERAFIRGWRRWTIGLVVLGYTALSALAAAGEKPFFALLFIAFPLFYGVLLRSGLRRILSGILRSRVRQAVLIFLFLWFSEIFAALDIANYDPPGRHMLVYIGFYMGLALVVVFFLPRWRYTFPALFTIGGVWGVLVERQFAGITMLASGNIVGFLTFASIIFPVYGFYLTGPYLLFYEEWNTNPRTNRWQYVLLFIALAIIPLVAWALWITLLGGLGLDTKVFVV